MTCVGWSCALALVKARLQSLLYFNRTVNSLLHVNSQEIRDRGKLLVVYACVNSCIAIHGKDVSFLSMLS